MTTTTREATTVVEYGVRYTWADGHTEIRDRDSRYSAELDVRMANRRDDGKAAELVTREVTTTGWEVPR